MSPALISLSSLYHRSFGVGTPITLHSRDTIPRCVNTALSGSMKIGFLNAFGTETTRSSRQVKEEFYKYFMCIVKIKK
jgi:hypothetical protein